MVYIAADGSISAAPPPSHNPIKRAANSVRSLPPRVAIGITVVVALIARSGMFDKYFGPLANGAIPAAKMAPSEHWKYMMESTTFVRTHTESLVGRTKATTKEGKQILNELETRKHLDTRADFGGPDGHAAEDSDFMSLEGFRVTRCATTRSGITAFYCGADVATDSDLAHGYDSKSSNYGTKSFRKYLTCRREQGQRDGTHQRLVYRLGVSCSDDHAGMSHAWSIVTQPDGTYYWLQSFINQYSLATWMRKTDSTKKSGISAQLTHDELMLKLDVLDRLMSITSWTYQANNDYLDLFNVDKDLEAVGGSRARPTKRWNDSHRLHLFSWDEACEWPLPKTEQNASADDDDAFASDECSALLDRISLFSIFDTNGDAFEELTNVSI